MLKYKICTRWKSLINQMGKRYCKKQKLGCNDPDNNLIFISLVATKKTVRRAA
jgi:endonuclease III-like uncharacterized protein